MSFLLGRANHFPRTTAVLGFLAFSGLARAIGLGG